MKISQIQTRKGIEPFLQIPLEEQADEGCLSCVEIDADKKMQTILGFGGAFTESAAYVYSKLNPENQEKVVSAYFHPETGIGYTSTHRQGGLRETGRDD